LSADNVGSCVAGLREVLVTVCVGMSGDASQVR